MNLFLFHAKRRWFLLLVGIALLMLYIFVQPGQSAYMTLTGMEIGAALIFGTFCSLTLSNPAEVEMCKCYGLAPSRLLTAQILPIFLIGSAFISLTLGLYRFEKPLLPDMRLTYILTPLVTVAFAVAVNAFFRVLTRNTYVVVFLNMTVLFFPFFSLHDKFRFVTGWKVKMFFDPALSAMLYNPQWDVTIQRFIVNRVIFLTLAIAFYIAACRLADRRAFEDFK